MEGMAAVLSSPALYHFSGKMGRTTLKYAPFLVNNGFNPWYKQRDMPAPPAESFGEWYQKNRS
jgi:L-lactate dehydrogenase complex protein LldF